MPTSAFDDPFDVDVEAARLSAAREAVAALLDFATDSRSAVSAGRKILTLAFLVGGLPGVHNQRQLAARLGCSNPAACKLMRAARRYLYKTRTAQS